MNALLATAAIVALSHTAIGIDHSLPFVALARARGWGLRRALVITLLCGLGHVLSSIAIGLGGWWLSAELGGLEALESVRGRLAGWLLLAFGIAYAILGGRRRHEHARDLVTSRSATFWSLFIVFAFGPCEPLIPLLLYPALQADALAVLAVVTVFTLVTLATMLALVTAGWKGLDLLPGRVLDRHAHTLAGLAIAASAAGILFLGL